MHVKCPGQDAVRSQVGSDGIVAIGSHAHSAEEKGIVSTVVSLHPINSQIVHSDSFLAVMESGHSDESEHAFLARIVPSGRPRMRRASSPALAHTSLYRQTRDCCPAAKGPVRLVRWYTFAPAGGTPKGKESTRAATDRCRLAPNSGEGEGSLAARVFPVNTSRTVICNASAMTPRQPDQKTPNRRCAIPDDLVLECNRMVGGLTGSTV